MLPAYRTGRRWAQAASVLLAVAVVSGCSGFGTHETDGHATALGKGWSRVDPMPIGQLPTSTMSGQVVSLDGSRPVLVNFWAGFCGPCREEVPLLRGVSSTSKHLTIVGVDEDATRAKADQAAQRLGVDYSSVYDAGQSFLGDSPVTVPGLPTSLLVQHGQVVAVHVGEFTTADDVEAYRDFVSGS